MSNELGAYNDSIQRRLKQVIGCVEGMSVQQLNWVPPIDGANSAYVIAVHALENARAWALGIACGQTISRIRPAEFLARVEDPHTVIKDWRHLVRDIQAALASLSPNALDRRLVPDRSLWGAGEPFEISVREVLLQVIEHVSMHLGHLQLTKDLALREKP